MSVYLDNASSVPCDPELLAYFSECAREFPGNQEAMGYHGSLAARRIAAAGEELAAAFGFSGVTSFFGNSGTEVLAVACEAACRAARKKNVITTALEHPALEMALKRSCARHGLALQSCPADRSGVRLEVLESLLSADTALVAVHHVQSETGGILDLAAVRALLDRAAPEAVLLIDSMQSLGKLPLDFPRIRPDFLVLSGSKLGAPGGAVLFCAGRQVKMVRFLRSAEHFTGRCPVPLLLTVARCGILAAGTQAENLIRAQRQNHLLRQELRACGLNFPATLPETMASPFILHLLTSPYQGAILTRSLHQHRISVAPGSACESETPGGSRALTAMGYSRPDCFCGLRISFWKDNSPEELRFFAGKLAECVRSY